MSIEAREGAIHRDGPGLPCEGSEDGGAVRRMSSVRAVMDSI